VRPIARSELVQTDPAQASGVPESAIFIAELLSLRRRMDGRDHCQEPLE
jgi:hypothetical protein